MNLKIFSRFNPGVWLITIISLLNSAALSISLPFLSLYLYEQRNVSMTDVGLIMLVTGLSSAAVQFFGGALSDRFGRKPPLFVSILAGAILYFGMAYLIEVSAPVIYIAFAYAAVRSALMISRPVISALLVDLTPKEHLTEAYGLLRVGQNLGWAVGPAVGGYLIAGLTYSWLFGIAGFVSLAGFFIMFNRFKETVNTHAKESVDLKNIFSTSRNTVFLQFTVVSLLLAIVASQMSGTLSVFTVNRVGFSAEQYGLLLSLNGLMVVAFQYPVARLTAKLTAWKVLFAACIMYAVGYFSMAWLGPFALAVVGMVVVSCGEITFSPTVLYVVSTLSPEQARGRYMGFYGLSETMGLAVGPLIGGVLLDGFPTAPVYVWGIIGLIALSAAFGYYRWGSSAQAAKKYSAAI